MGRWRPPNEKTIPYITAAGYLALEIEMHEHWRRRREVVKHLAAAAAEGDRSENAEYQYRKKELREIDRRILYLERRMPELTIVTQTPDDPDRVFFGAVVQLEDKSGNLRSYHIIGGDEAVPGAGSISIDAPLARKLLGRGLDDEVEMTIDGQVEVMQITAIDYPLA